MEKLESDFKEYELKKNGMRKMYDSLHLQASSMLHFTLEWKELEGSLDSMRNATQARLEELYEREKQLDAKVLKMKSKAKEFQEREKQLDAKVLKMKSKAKEFQEREKQLDARELKMLSEAKEFQERKKQLELEIQSKVDEVFGIDKLLKEKQEEAADSMISLQSLIQQHMEVEKELGDKEREIERRIQELNGVERNTDEKLKKSHEELNLIQRKIKEQGVEFDLKEQQIKAEEEKLKHMEKCIREELKLDLEEQNRAFDLKEKQIKEKEENLNRIEKTTEVKWKLAIEEQNRAFELKEKQIKVKEENLNRTEKSTEEKMKLAIEEQKKAFDLKQECIKKEQKLREVRLKEEEKLKEHKKSVVEDSKTLKSREELKREIELKVKNYYLRKKSMEEWSSNLERKGRELELKEKQVLSKDEELDSLNIRTLTEFELMEKQFSSREHTIEEREKKLEADSQRLQEKQRDLFMKSEAIEKFQQECEGKEKQVELKAQTMKKLHQERQSQLEVKERELEELGKELELSKKQQESTLAARNVIVSSSATDNFKINIRDGTGLQLFMYEHMKRNDSVSKEISALLQGESLEPAKLVLDAMEGFHPSNSTVYNDLDLVLIRRQCVFLLEELKKVSAQINPQVREEAMQLASDWKAKMKVGAENWLEVLGFLQLVTTYELISAYDANELQCLLDMVPQHEHAIELSRTPGTTDKAPTSITVASVKDGKAQSPVRAMFSSPNLQPTAKINIIDASVTTKRAPDVRTENGKAPAAANFSSPNLQSAATVPPAVIMGIQNSIDQKKLGNAFKRIHKHNLFDMFPPAQILKEYVWKAMQCREYSERETTLHQKDLAVKQGIELLLRAIQWIKHYNLESQYPSESIRKQIVVLNKFMEERKRFWKKRPCSILDSSFQHHEHKIQRKSAYDGKEFQSLPDRVAQHEQTAELSQALGTIKKAPANSNICSPVESEKPESPNLQHTATTVDAMHLWLFHLELRSNNNGSHRGTTRTTSPHPPSSFRRRRPRRLRPPPDLIKEAFFEAATAVNSRAPSIFTAEDDDEEDCLNDPWPVGEGRAPGACGGERGGGVEVSGDEVVVGGEEEKRDEVIDRGEEVGGDKACVDGLVGLEIGEKKKKKDEDKNYKGPILNRSEVMLKP